MAARAAKSAKDTLSPLRKFFVSDNGRNIVRGVGVCCSGVAVGIYVFAHTWGKDKYVSIIQHYKHGFPSQPSKELTDRVEHVGTELGLRERFRDAVKVFHVYGFDPYLIGSLKTIQGVSLGLPKYFEYKTTKDVEKQDILIEQKPVKWETEEGINFRDSLVLSENAQKFAIAQRLAMADHNYVQMQGALGGSSIVGYTILSGFLNSKFYGFYKPLSFRIFVYTLAGTFCYGVWSTTRDLYNKHVENSADEQAGRISLDYAKGGVEYYATLIKRNIALRDLMGPTGEKLFTAVGNHSQFLRQKYTPLTVRKENMEKLVERLHEESQNNNNNKKSRTSSS